MVVDLKFNRDATAAIDQIQQKNYPAKVQDYLNSPSPVNAAREILLVGINYDREKKNHTCKIERCNV